MEINKELVQILLIALGKRTADLFAKFFAGESEKEQVKGAHEILSEIVGEAKTRELLKDYLPTNETT